MTPPRALEPSSDAEHDVVFRHGRVLTMRDGIVPQPDWSVAARDGRVVWAGPDAALSGEAAHEIDLAGRLVTPGLIDCHTHLVHGGNRAREFELRLDGATYEEIARAGGGIASTVTATREAGEAGLARQSAPRLDALIAEGVTTVEIKSGYGLDETTELAMLRTARALGRSRPVTIRTSYLGAHAFPKESSRNDYLALITERVLPAIRDQHLADAVDGFCEGIAFTPAEITRVFAAARALGLPVKLHADQLSDLDGAALAASFGALSADHLEHTSEAGVQAMAEAGTIAVLLPGAYYFIRETKQPPLAALRRYGVPIAIATDCNPGSSPLTSLLLTMNMAATLFRMTVAECLAGVTKNAAAALGIADAGTIAEGSWCDLAIWDVESPAELVYRIGYNPLHRRVWQGK